MSVPKNNLAEQMALFTEKRLKTMLKRKRLSEPISSERKRVNTERHSSPTPTCNMPSGSSRAINLKQSTLSFNSNATTSDTIPIPDEDDTTSVPSSISGTFPTTGKREASGLISVCDTMEPADINTTDGTRSLGETIEEFDLFDSKQSSTSHPQQSDSLEIVSSTIPDYTSDRTALPRCPSSPDKKAGIMVKVQPTKGVKNFSKTASSSGLPESPVKDIKASRSRTLTNEEYVSILEEMCDLVGDCREEMDLRTTNRIRELQEIRRDMQRRRNEVVVSPDDRSAVNCQDMFVRDVQYLDEEEEYDQGHEEDDGMYGAGSVTVDSSFKEPEMQQDPWDEVNLFGEDDEEMIATVDLEVATQQAREDASIREEETSFTASQLNLNRKISDHEELARTDFPFSRLLLEGFRKVFGLHKFRKNQLECINATLLGMDCFVLMPTGGGKSLCYQLPALMKEGITIVVSPLKSLIQDQVQKLVQLGIPASHLSGSLTQSQANQVFKDLSSKVPQLRLLYVTPEKISLSTQLNNIFLSLYKRDMLNRFVIDEAHCVSQWGHDFRPDYTKLGKLRSMYPGVPVMGLTATAAPRVRADVVHNLLLKNPKVFIASFNRSNLKYIITPKPRKTFFTGIAEQIKRSYARQCGIVYCLSRKDCEQCADEMGKAGIKCAPYHAGLTDIQRSGTQKKWIDDEIQVVCATIAFGMGIDKHDVRYVIHHTLPKSVEGFYQESGRAGRDGDPADCILYYHYGDVGRIKNIIMLDRSPEAQATRSVHFDNLNYMVQYCENRMDCRRTQLLAYFGETFSPSECQRVRRSTCDNCISLGKYESRDMTDHAKTVLSLVSAVSSTYRGGNFTLLHYADILRGADVVKVKRAGHNTTAQFGKLKCLGRNDVERLLRRLVSDKMLEESITVGQHGMVISYIKMGRSAQELLSGKRRVLLDIETNRRQQLVTDNSDSKVDAVVVECYDALLECRKALARDRGVLVHNILTTETLHEMSEVRPHTEAQLTNITGVTQLKIDFYGETFLGVLRRFKPGKPISNNTTDFIQNPKWINTNGPPPAQTTAKKPRNSAGGFDKYKYKNQTGSKPGPSRAAKPTPTTTPCNPMVGLMPMPVPKKPKLGSIHRRL